jgi:L-amino acid N-acyltransferase YncA
MTSRATIRPADPARDGAACAEIYAPSVTSSPTSFELEPPDAAAFARRIAAYSATHQFLVAERAGKVVGFAYAARFAERPAYRWSVETSVYIDAAHHGEGLGRALYTELFERLRAQGFRVVMAGVTLPNAASVALHEGMGFEPAGVLPGIGWKFGAWHDVGWWTLRLPEPDEGTPAEPLPPSAV